MGLPPAHGLAAPVSHGARPLLPPHRGHRRGGHRRGDHCGPRRGCAASLARPRPGGGRPRDARSSDQPARQRCRGGGVRRGGAGRGGVGLAPVLPSPPRSARGDVSPHELRRRPHTPDLRGRGHRPAHVRPAPLPPPHDHPLGLAPAVAGARHRDAERDAAPLPGAAGRAEEPPRAPPGQGMLPGPRQRGLRERSDHGAPPRCRHRGPGRGRHRRRRAGLPRGAQGHARHGHACRRAHRAAHSQGGSARAQHRHGRPLRRAGRHRVHGQDHGRPPPPAPAARGRALPAEQRGVHRRQAAGGHRQALPGDGGGGAVGLPRGPAPLPNGPARGGQPLAPGREHPSGRWRGRRLWRGQGSASQLRLGGRGQAGRRRARQPRLSGRIRHWAGARDEAAARRRRGVGRACPVGRHHLAQGGHLRVPPPPRRP
mmetsp:Transcript_8243/g.32500  ORF Transcript_8243/g.32500 Transcript_8243/m.32500 type:complete len:427 (-) Transcript_8243:233-1513(-)